MVSLGRYHASPQRQVSPAWPVARGVERVKFVPFRQNHEGVRSLEAGVGAACKTEARSLQGHDRDALRCGRCFVKASSVWIAGVLQSTTDRERMA
jgi:hypothetical protein